MDERSTQPDAGNGNGDDTSPSWDPNRVPVEELAADFADRHRQGERPTIDEYVSKHPELADEIRELFPVVATMEQMQDRIQHDLRVVRSKAPFSIQQLGDYRVIGEIARGGMGIVCEAEQVTLGRRVAVKVLPEHALRSPKDIQRFSREAQTAAKLHHSNIVPVFGVGEQDGVHYIVMQLIQGLGLDEILPEIKRIVLGGPPEGSSTPSSSSVRASCARRNAEALLSEDLSTETARPASSNGVAKPARAETAGFADRTDPIDESSSEELHQTAANHSRQPKRAKVGQEYWRNVARIGIQAAKALAYAHSQGTLHRDVKPGNLLLDEDGVVWMADFGLAKAVEQDAVTWTGDIVGTLRYMAPERFHGEADSRSDIYSLGLTLYELLTFKRAFDGTDRVALTHNVTMEDLVPPRRHNLSIPQDLETIVLKAAAREPSDRYENAEHLANDLECFLEDRPIRARRAGPGEQFVRWCRRNRAVACLAATVALVLLGASISTTLGYMRESNQRRIAETERRIAETERRRAEATSQLAVGALDRIYGQFAPSPVQPAIGTSDDGGDSLLAPQSQLPLSTDVALLLESLLDFYDKLSFQSEGDETVLLKSVMAKRRVGDIQHQLGETRKARAAYESAIEQVAMIGDSFSEKESLRLELARIHNGLGSVLDSQRETKSAIASHRRAMKLLEPTSVTPEPMYELARSSYLLHLAERSYRRRSRQEDGIDNRNNYIHQAVTLLTELTEKYPGIPNYRFLLARCCRVDGQGDDEERRVRAIRILEALVDEFPEVPDYRYELGDAYAVDDFERLWSWNQSEINRSPQGLGRAEERLLRALDSTQDIDISHPNIPSYLRLKARLLHTYATVLRDMGKQDAALQHFHRAVDKQRLVVRHSRDGHFQEVLLAHIKLDLAEMLRAAGQTSDADVTLQAVVTELSALLADPACGFTSFSRNFARDILTKSQELISE